MEANIEEALKAKDIAEKRFAEKDFAGAKNYALKAKTLCPGLEGISQMLTTFEVYIASEAKCNGELDYYSILGLKPFADKNAVKKQYKKMAVLLHPDKNKCVGADGAFRLVSEAWTLLSDISKRSSYDRKRNKQLAPGVSQTNLAPIHATGVPGFNNCSNSPNSHGRLDTFWTVCTSCKVQYEYLRKYVNKRLSCKNCRSVFIAVETGTAPANGSFPYSPWSHVPGNGYGSHGFDGVTYIPANPAFVTGNGVSGFHSAHGYEYVSNVSFQWSSFSGTSAGIVGPNGPSTISTDVYQANGNVNQARAKVKSGANRKHSLENAVATINSSSGCSEPPGPKAGRAEKKRKVVMEASFRNGYEDKGLKSASEARLADGNNASNGQDPKPNNSSELLTRRWSIPPAFDARKLLIEKARTEIKKKLKEMKLASEAAAPVKQKAEAQREVDRSGGIKYAPKKDDLGTFGHQLEPKKPRPVSLTVPDPDFHDFDKDRSEECFKPKQIWALYDEEDGMPRLYCLIREVISVEPFKIHITYLNSKTDSEFGLVNWLDCGFTKSCGNFRVWNSDVVDRVNIFSHVLSQEKAGRGGCVRIYPRSGDIWAIYRNWSVDWSRSTPDEVRYQYEMVEILENYSEELGVCVAPLVKLAGFKTVYQRNTDKNSIRWIRRREMLRFSHQVPSCPLKEGRNNLPGKCWDLDPAATPDELLHAATGGNA